MLIFLSIMSPILWDSILFEPLARPSLKQEESRVRGNIWVKLSSGHFIPFSAPCELRVTLLIIFKHGKHNFGGKSFVVLIKWRKDWKNEQKTVWAMNTVTMEYWHWCHPGLPWCLDAKFAAWRQNTFKGQAGRNINHDYKVQLFFDHTQTFHSPLCKPGVQLFEELSVEFIDGVNELE